MQKRIKSCYLILLAFAIAVSSVAFSYQAYAEEEQMRLGRISQNCSSIKLQLSSVQKSDSKERVRLGVYYEFFSSKMIMNLNLRLVRNNIAATELTEQQSKFSEQRELFKNDFVSYSQSLEKLVAKDCKNDPEGFDKLLNKTRQKRKKLATRVDAINEILKQHEESLDKIITKLEEAKNE